MIRTFGRFDVFVAATLIHFPNAKSKELLALCVDRRGSGVTMEEAIGLLWPDTPYDEKAKRRYRKAIMMLHHTLNMHGIPDIFVSSVDSATSGRKRPMRLLQLSEESR